MFPYCTYIPPSELKLSLLLLLFATNAQYFFRSKPSLNFPSVHFVLKNLRQTQKFMSEMSVFLQQAQSAADKFRNIKLLHCLVPPP